MFMLKGKEFTFDVELSTMPCGFNAALYFVGMTANEGAASGAKAMGATTTPSVPVAAGGVCDMEQYASCACAEALTHIPTLHRRLPLAQGIATTTRPCRVVSCSSTSSAWRGATSSCGTACAIA